MESGALSLRTAGFNQVVLGGVVVIRLINKPQSVLES